MKRLARMMGCSLISLCAVGLMANGVLAQTQIDLTRTSTYQAGSAEARTARLWLREHAHYLNGNMIGDLDELGDITVTYQATQRGSTDYMVASPGDGLPVALPPSGNNGDTITVSSCGGDGVGYQSWTYQWCPIPLAVAGYWFLIPTTGSPARSADNQNTVVSLSSSSSPVEGLINLRNSIIQARTGIQHLQIIESK